MLPVAAAHPDNVGRMIYANFDSSISEKFGIVVDNWPLPTFGPPSRVESRTDLETLFHCWSSGATRFRRLTATEFQEYKQKRALERAAVASAAANAATPTTPDALVPPDAPNALATTAASTEDSNISTTTNPTATATVATPIVLQDVRNVPRGDTPSPKRTFEYVMDPNTATTAPKRQRKKRSDAGVKRGPYAKKPDVTK